MPGILLETKKKIGSFKGTRKITKAMELVAASKMRHFQKRAISTRLFAWDLVGVLRSNLAALEQHELLTSNPNGPDVFIIYTSDKGLCGGLNNALIKTLIHSPAWLSCSPEKRLLITIGKKSLAFAQFNNIPVYKSFQNVSENLTALGALEIIQSILATWEDLHCRKVYMIAPHYKNAFEYYPQVKTFLPFTPQGLTELLGPTEKQTTWKAPEYVYYEPNQAEVAGYLVSQVVIATFLAAFWELKASEYSSRMIAMKNATEATDKIINNLTLTLNKARQQSITTELADLINSSEGMNSEQELSSFTETLRQFFPAMSFVVVETVQAISPELQEKISDILALKYGQVFPLFYVNEHLLGGMRVFIDGHMIDHSWLGKIQNLYKVNY